MFIMIGLIESRILISKLLKSGSSELDTILASINDRIIDSLIVTKDGFILTGNLEAISKLLEVLHAKSFWMFQLGSDIVRMFGDFFDHSFLFIRYFIQITVEIRSNQIFVSFCRL